MTSCWSTNITFLPSGAGQFLVVSLDNELFTIAKARTDQGFDKTMFEACTTQLHKYTTMHLKPQNEFNALTEKYALLLHIVQVPGALMFQNLYHGPLPFIR